MEPVSFHLPPSSSKCLIFISQVVSPINNLIDTVPFDMHCYSLDWHPSDHVSFIDNIHLRELHPDSKVQDHTKAELYQTVVFSGPPKTEQVKIGSYI